MDKKTLYIILPCYNEQEVLISSSEILLAKLRELITQKNLSEQSRIVFVDDGSKDNTWQIICSLHNTNAIFQGIKLAHNRGHQNALLAGLSYAKDYADMMITVDADLQDDVDIFATMIDKYNEGAMIVFGVKKSRHVDNVFKRMFAVLFYRFMAYMGVEIIFNHADCRLMGAQAVKALLEYGESHLFLRGLVPLLGFTTSIVSYEISPRKAGKTKFPLRRQFAFAWDGITSFSVKPLTLATRLGVLTLIATVVANIYFISRNSSMDTWIILLLAMCYMFSMLFILLGIIGEYIGKIYQEVKKRPRFFIEEIKN